MGVVVDIVGIKFERGDDKVKNFTGDVVAVGLMPYYKFSLKELRNVDNDGHDDRWKDVGEEVDLGGVTQLVTSVKKRLTDSKIAFCSDAHDQENLQTQKDVYHWIQKVWENDDMEKINKA